MGVRRVYGELCPVSYLGLGHLCIELVNVVTAGAGIEDWKRLTIGGYG